MEEEPMAKNGEKWRRMAKNFIESLGLIVWKILHFAICRHWFPLSHEIREDSHLM